MAAPQNGEPGPSRVIGSISKHAGALVGTAVVTVKRIVSLVTPPSKGPSDKHREKTVQAPAKRKKKAVRKTEIKIPKTKKKKKKKKVLKRKGTDSSGKSGASNKKPIQSPAKKKEGATPKKKTTRRKTNKTVKSEGYSHSQDGLISEIGAGANVPIGKQEPLLQMPIAEAEMADEKSSRRSVIASSKAGIEKIGVTRTHRPSVRIIEYSNKPKKAVVPTTSVL